MPAGRRIIAFEETAMAELGAGDADDDDAIDDQRRARHCIPIGDCRGRGRSRVPQLLAGFRIHRNDVIVEQGADDLAFVDGGAAVDDAAAYDAQSLRRILMIGAP